MRIKIKKRFLIFREEAEKLKKISKEKLNNFNWIEFDFSEVDFFSRSFIDQLLNIMEKNKGIKIINLKPSLKKFFNKIKKTKEKIKTSL